MPKVAQMKGFDTINGQETRHTMPEAHALVKRAGIVSRVGADALLKDKAGRIFAELYDYAKYTRWVEEHPEAAAS